MARRRPTTTTAPASSTSRRTTSSPSAWAGTSTSSGSSGQPSSPFDVRDRLGARGEHPVEERAERGDRAGPVAERVLLAFGELGHRLVGAVDEEEGVVAEAPGAP